MKQFSPRNDELRRFALFVIVGVLAAIASLVVRGLLSHVVLFEVAVALAQLAGLVVAFALARMVVFTSFSGSLTGAFRRFFVINVFSLAIVTVVSALFYRSALPLLGWSLYPDYAAHFIGLGCATMPSYLGHRFYSFRT
jgi:putative flippase GtrA